VRKKQSKLYLSNVHDPWHITCKNQNFAKNEKLKKKPTGKNAQKSAAHNHKKNQDCSNCWYSVFTHYTQDSYI